LHSANLPQIYTSVKPRGKDLKFMWVDDKFYKKIGLAKNVTNKVTSWSKFDESDAKFQQVCR